MFRDSIGIGCVIPFAQKNNNYIFTKETKFFRKMSALANLALR